MNKIRNNLLLVQKYFHPHATPLQPFNRHAGIIDCRTFGNAIIDGRFNSKMIMVTMYSEHKSDSIIISKN